jgi:hypothetical protein
MAAGVGSWTPQKRRAAAVTSPVAFKRVKCGPRRVVEGAAPVSGGLIRTSCTVPGETGKELVVEG